ncbi:AraC family transcriptional regulator [Metabacillus halosaccharovorans]|uniref:AraC family transcriptional regulator n=1 Tax=Metabacillus halosaccharovorans TaxID=930124 RepID=UPI001C1FFF3D|nr:AraC family transcriptional regulator [Metabacillus halosaccharovorans]MBU7591121.1 helix-turn-helix transcriptional regulator [Metabacillus halosaccharovorans]
MLGKNEILDAFRQLTGSCYEIWNWKYDSRFNVIESDCPNESLFNSLFFANGRLSAIEKYMSENTLPIVFTSSTMLSWIVAFEPSSVGINAFYVKGPFFSGYNDPESYSDIINAIELTSESEKMMLSSLKKLPMLTSSSIMQFAIMLHYCLTGKSISVDEVSSLSPVIKTKKTTVKVMIDQFEGEKGYWNIEQELLNSVRNGDLDVVKVVNRATPLMSGIFEGDKKSVGFYKQKIHVLLTLVSRAAAEGGMSRKLAYSLCADYRRMLNKCSSMSEVNALSNEILLDYVYRVRESKKVASCSSQIRACCEYINLHLDEKLSLEFLAKEVGYSDYHLSRKFNKEMGCSINDYIQNERLEKAKYLLTTTNTNIEKISIDLGFGSRSYFTSIFKKNTGETPSEYRKNQTIIM